MQQALQYCAWTIGLFLNLLVISVLVRGTYRQYPFVFAYTIASLVSTAVEIGVRAFPRDIKANYYWTDEVILDILVFCVVIAFIDEAAQQSTRRVIERRWLILAAALILVISFTIHRSLHLNRQMTLISRDLNISAVVLDLILWSLLVAARRPDRHLMLLSGGLGMQLTGAIMGEQLRHFSHDLYPVGTLLEVASSLLGTYIWWRALRSLPAAEIQTIKKGGFPQEPTRY
jgi:hypothetical protein